MRRQTSNYLLRVAMAIGVAFLLFAGLGGSGTSSAREAETDETTEVPATAGADLCAACHADVAAEQKNDWHSLLIQTQPDSSNCEECHGPSLAHASDPLTKSTFQDVSRAPAGDSAQACLACHETGDGVALWKASEHALADVRCWDCHSHGASSHSLTIERPGKEVCYACHQEQATTFELTSHHPVSEERLDCYDCHNAHAPQYEADKQDVCVSCHVPQGSPFIYAHGAISGELTEGCLDCHRAHGSPNRRLLKFPGRGLCLQCHADHALHFVSRTCWTSGCHTDVHGSNDSPLLRGISLRQSQGKEDGNDLSGTHIGNSSNNDGWCRSEHRRMEQDNADNNEVLENVAIGIGLQSQSVDGNERRFYQYVTPAENIYLGQYDRRQWNLRDRLFVNLHLRELGEPGSTANLRLISGDDLAMRGDYRRSSYYFDFASNSERMRRRDHRVKLNSPPSPRGKWSWQVAESEVGLRGRPAAGAVDWAERNRSAAAALRGQDYILRLEHRRQDSDLRTGNWFSSETSHYGLSVASRGSEDTSLVGNFLYRRTDIDGLDDDVKIWRAALTATHTVDDTLRLIGVLNRRKVDTTITQNAYARQNTYGRLEAHYSMRPRTNLTGFWQTGEVDYVDGRQFNVVTVAVNTLGLRVKTRLEPQLTLHGNYRRRDVWDRPLSYTANDALANTLVYSTAERLNLSLLYTPFQFPGGLTAQWQRDSWENDAQGVYNRLKTTALTGWWQAPEGDLSATASYLRQGFHLPGISGLNSELGYSTRAESFVLNTNYRVCPETEVFATYTDATTWLASATDYQRVTLGATHQMRTGATLSAHINLGAFEDLADHSLDYDADLYRLEWRGEF